MDALNFEDLNNKVVDEYNEMFRLGKKKDVVCLSNLGVASIISDYDSYSIERIEFVSPLTLGFKCNVSAITINNTFSLSMSCLDYDEDYLNMFSFIEEGIRNAIYENSEISTRDIFLVC